MNHDQRAKANGGARRVVVTDSLGQRHVFLYPRGTTGSRIRQDIPSQLAAQGASGEAINISIAT